jgi:hypothetical protein
MGQKPPQTTRQPFRRRIETRRIRAAIGCLVLAWSHAPAGGEVILALSGESESYQEADTGVRSVLIEIGYTVRTMQIDALAPDLAKETRHAEGVIAICSRASRWQHQNLTPEVSLAYCIVGDPVEAALVARATYRFGLRDPVGDQGGNAP